MGIGNKGLKIKNKLYLVKIFVVKNLNRIFRSSCSLVVARYVMLRYVSSLFTFSFVVYGCYCCPLLLRLIYAKVGNFSIAT